MFCAQCGKEYPEKVNYCSQCGTAMFAPYVAHKKLTRSRRDEKIAGVCGGIAEYLELDSTLVRVAWVMLALFGGWGVVGYLVAWIIMPKDPAVVPVASTIPSGAPQAVPNR